MGADLDTKIRARFIFAAEKPNISTPSTMGSERGLLFEK